MESMADILAGTRRCRAEAVKRLTAIERGARAASPMTRQEAITILRESIAQYDAVLRRYGRTMSRDSSALRRDKREVGD